MNWYRGWDFPRYVSVAERKAQAARALGQLARRRGRAVEPVVIARRAIATTFWGKAWCDNLERYMDFVNRLPRGRTYVRNGAVVDLQITPGTVRALVAGSDLYTVAVEIAALPRSRWRGMVARAAGRIGSLVALLRGELPDDVLATMVDADEGLFPAPRDIAMTCSCPDAARMCKHIAAVLYGVGARLDTRPELFFTLRRVDQADLVARATAGAVEPRAGGRGKRIAADRIAGVFGIELDDATPPAPTPGARARASAPPSSARTKRPAAAPKAEPRRAASRGGRGRGPRPRAG